MFPRILIILNLFFSFRKKKERNSSLPLPFFKAFTNASHKIFLTSRKLFSQCLVKIRFLASSKKYNVVGMYILEREDPRNPLALESEEFVSMRSRFLFKLAKSNLQSLFCLPHRVIPTHFPRFICHLQLYPLILIFILKYITIIIIIENSIDRRKIEKFRFVNKLINYLEVDD